MNWRQFCSPEQNKMFNAETMNMAILSKKSNNKNKLSSTSHIKKGNESKKSQTKKMNSEKAEDSISQLFDQILITENFNYHHKKSQTSILQTLIEIKNISKDQLDYQKRIYQTIQKKYPKRQSKSKTTKKISQNTLQKKVNQKIQQLERLKTHLQALIRNNSLQKTIKKQTKSALNS